jgi:Transposase
MPASAVSDEDPRLPSRRVPASSSAPGRRSAAGWARMAPRSPRLLASSESAWRTAMAAVREHGQPRVADQSRLAGVAAVGVDETAFQAAAATRATSFVTGIVELTRGRGPARMFDVVAGRNPSALLSWVNDQDSSWRTRVTTAALDPYRGYASALRTALPDAVCVLDAFPVVRLGFAAVDDVRRRIQQEQLGHCGRAGEPFIGIRRCCGGATTTTPTVPGRACCPGWTPATPSMTNSSAPGSQQRSCA